MSIFRNDTLGSWTRGGQAIVHNVRMSTQVLFQTCMASVVLWAMGTLWYAYEQLGEWHRYVVLKLIEATIKSEVPGGAAPMLFRTPFGYQYTTTSSGLLNSGVAKATLAQVQHHLIHGALLVGAGTLGALFFAWWCFTRTGRDLGSNQFLRGARFGSPRQLRRRLFWKRKGSLKIAGIRVPESFETEHLLLVGAPGTGKTNLITTMLEGIRKNGRRAIVYDAAGTFVERFYRPGRDIILNPLDERSARWTPWLDVPEACHYDQIAESVIPDKAGDPFWAEAARGTLVAVLRALVARDQMLVSVLLDTILRSPLKDLAEFVEDTEGAAFISKEGDRTAAGVQAELASKLRSFTYLDDTDEGLSIREWVANEQDDSWLFITVKADQLSSLRPLITVWLDIAISAIMSLEPDRDRRLYVVVDELPTLQRLPSLADFLARARKYGGCGILGFQSYPQLEATYGIQGAAAITGYCSTWIGLRANDTPTARLLSENLGQAEQVEANEGMSYGVNDMRDGVNLSRAQVTRPLVLPTEIVNLENLHGFLRFGRNLPVVRFRARFRKGRVEVPAFVKKVSPPERLPSGPVAQAGPERDQDAPTSDAPAKPTVTRNIIENRAGIGARSLRARTRDGDEPHDVKPA